MLYHQKYYRKCQNRDETIKHLRSIGWSMEKINLTLNRKIDIFWIKIYNNTKHFDDIDFRYYIESYIRKGGNWRFMNESLNILLQKMEILMLTPHNNYYNSLIKDIREIVNNYVTYGISYQRLCICKNILWESKRLDYVPNSDFGTNSKRILFQNETLGQNDSECTEKKTLTKNYVYASPMVFTTYIDESMVPNTYNNLPDYEIIILSIFLAILIIMWIFAVFNCVTNYQ